MSDMQQIIDIYSKVCVELIASINAASIERVRILREFGQLADEIEIKAGRRLNSDAGLAFTAAASGIRRVMKEVSE